MEFAKWVFFKSSKHTLPALGLGIFEKFFSESDPNHPIFLRLCDELRDDLELLLGDDGVLVSKIPDCLKQLI
jgi:fatty acid amide hydrolase 2